MDSPFSITKALQFGWSKVRQESRVVFIAIVTLLSLEFLQEIIQVAINGTASVKVALVLACIDAVLVFTTFVGGVGATTLFLKLAKNEPVVLRDLLPSRRIFVQYVAANIAVSCFVLFGVGIPLGIGLLLLLFIPSAIVAGFLFALSVACTIISLLYLALRYMMVNFIAVDGPHTVREMIHRSGALSRGVKWHLLLFICVTVLINILGFLALVVGLLITIPVTAIAAAHIYLQLGNRSNYVVSNNEK